MRLAAGKLLIPAGKSLVASLVQTFGTLRNYDGDGDGDGDGNGNVKNSIGLKSKTTTLHVRHAFLHISLLSLHNQDASWPNFKFTWERKRQGDKVYHLCQNSGAVPSLQLQPNSLLLSNWAPWNNREKKWKDAKTLFQRRFHGRRRCRTVRPLIESLRRPLLRRSWMRNAGESTST